MGATGTIIPTITAEQFALRMADDFPLGWASQDAKFNGVMAAVLADLGDPLAFLMSGTVYAATATRIQTATDTALDDAALDFFGTGIYALPRNAGETDTSYRARILAALLPNGATRAAVQAAVETASGYPCRIIEPWSPADTGVIDGVRISADNWDGSGDWDSSMNWDAGVTLIGAIYLDVDTLETPGLITDPSLAFQGFIQAILPGVQPIGQNAVPCMDSILYLDVPGCSMFDFEYSFPLGEQIVFNAIERSKVYGTEIWVQFSAPGTSSSVVGPTWNAPNLYWNEPGLTWG